MPCEINPESGVASLEMSDRTTLCPVIVKVFDIGIPSEFFSGRRLLEKGDGFNFKPRLPLRVNRNFSFQLS